jgi:threonyl-tRNA synthetase
LRAENMRVQVDDGPERMQNKIRRAQLSKIPYMLVVGDKEVQTESVAVRLRSGEDLKAQSVGEFIARAKALIARYALALWE